VRKHLAAYLEREVVGPHGLLGCMMKGETSSRTQSMFMGNESRLRAYTIVVLVLMKRAAAKCAYTYRAKIA
jgi:hypothetical protein